MVENSRLLEPHCPDDFVLLMTSIAKNTLNDVSYIIKEALYVGHCIYNILIKSEGVYKVDDLSCLSELLLISNV